MKKFFSLVVMALALLLFRQPTVMAEGKLDAPEARAAAFYSWFMKNDSDQSYPLNKQEIYGYVSEETVERLRVDYKRGGAPNGVDYFLKVQDYDGHDWLTHIEPHPAIMLNRVAVVPVTFGSKDKVDVLVFMEKQSGLWKITKVNDTWAYQ
jgi:Protein of unknown function (DUF3828)